MDRRRETQQMKGEREEGKYLFIGQRRRGNSVNEGKRSTPIKREKQNRCEKK